jgi:hypothetical protein
MYVDMGTPGPIVDSKYGAVGPELITTKMGAKDYKITGTRLQDWQW